MQLFKSAQRVRKERSAASSSRELQGVQFLMSRAQSRNSRRAGGAILAFTSANPGEGVSHVVQFFATKLATQTGKPTLVVNAEQLGNLRYSDLMDMHGVAKTGVASGNGNGNGNGNGKVLDHERLRELESETGLDLLLGLRPALGYTLIDCPPLSASPEAALLAPEVDGVVLVVEADRTKRDQIFRARQTIEMAHGNLMGLVLNKRRHVVPEWVFRRL